MCKRIKVLTIWSRIGSKGYSGKASRWVILYSANIPHKGRSVYWFVNIKLKLGIVVIVSENEMIQMWIITGVFNFTTL